MTIHKQVRFQPNPNFQEFGTVTQTSSGYAIHFRGELIWDCINWGGCHESLANALDTWFPNDYNGCLRVANAFVAICR